MAITHVGSNTQDFAGAYSLTFTLPTHQTDDFMIAFVKQSENTTQRTWDDDGGGGNGWTREVYNRTTGGRDMETAIYWKIATSASETNPTFTWWSGGTTSEPMSGMVEIYRGVEPLYPFTEVTYLNATNDSSPPNPNVRVDFINTRVVCFHGATHDDITAVAAPTGFTLRSQVWAGTANDHRNVFSADIEVDTLGSYSPPDWQHTGNATPEYHTYSIALNEVQPILITTPTENTNFEWSDTNQTITGKGFEATQGTGKVELWSDTSGTTKVTQTIDTWADTSIQFDFVQGSLVDGINYLVVTNDTGDVTAARPIILGFIYAPWTIGGMGPDHYWAMNNSYDDEAARGGVDRPFNINQIGPPDFVATPITRTNTHSFRIDVSTERSEVADSVYTNVTNTHADRNIGGWIRIEDLQTIPAGIYEEGGGVNNIYMIILPNGRLVINVADSGNGFKAQAYADFPLIIGRPYHVLIELNLSASPEEFYLWVDGEQQTLTAGSVTGETVMATHSGDWCFGRPDGALDTGGVDITYNAGTTIYMAHWGTWSNTGGTAPLSSTEIQNNLFREGALAEHIIAVGTESAMQTAIEAFDTQTHADWPLTFEIAPKSGGGDLELTITDQVWPDEVKLQVFYFGSDKLTIRNSGTSNFTTSKAYSPNSGTFAVIETAPVKITVRDIDTGSDIQNARVLLEADTGGPLTAGDDIISGLTDVNGEISTEIDFTSNQPVVGVVRKQDGGDLYIQGDIIGTVTSTGLDLTILLIPDI